MTSDLSNNYKVILDSLKEKIRQARLRSTLTVNYQMLQTYWEVGDTVLSQQSQEGWGAKIIDRLAKDLQTEFPDMKGLSVRNLKYMRAFAETYPHFPFVQEGLALLPENSLPPIVQVPLAQISWYHHITLMDKIKEPNERFFYIQKTIENGWSRDVLVHQIETGLYSRQGRITSNFKTTLPSLQSELTQQIFKDPYHLDFLKLSEEILERDIEDALMHNLIKFLLELGDGFAFMGRQHKLEVGGKDYRIDLLFYHTKLKRHIVIDLKIGDFEPEFVSKMSFYLNAIDDKLKTVDDGQSIGLILCKTKNKVIAEYALRDSNKPIGVSEYKLNKALPSDMKGELPTIAEIEEKMEDELSKPRTAIDSKLEELKSKIAGIKKEGLKVKKSPAILRKVFQNDLLKLYKSILLEVSKLDEMFMEKKISWGLNNNSEIKDINEIEKDIVGSDEKLKNILQLRLEIYFKGFTKGETQAFGVWNSLDLLLEDYWYDFSLDRTKFNMRKLYHQPLQKDETEAIRQAVLNDLMVQIENHLKDIK